MKKPARTDQDIKANAKTRLKRHRDTMASKGYKPVSVFMGAELISELNRLGATGLTRHGALDHILNTYLKTISQAV